VADRSARARPSTLACSGMACSSCEGRAVVNSLRGPDIDRLSESRMREIRTSVRKRRGRAVARTVRACPLLYFIVVAFILFIL